MRDDEYALGETCEKCKCTTKITYLFPVKVFEYYCKCNHPSNKNILTKLLWILNGRPAMEIKNKLDT